MGPRQKTKVAKPEDLRYASRGGPYFVPIYDIRTSQGRQDAAAISKRLFDKVLFRVKIDKFKFRG